MRNLDIRRSLYVSYSTGNTKNSIENTCRKMEFFCRRYGDFLCLFLYGSVFFYVDIRHFRISMELGSRESFLLNIASMLDSFSEFFGSLIFRFSLEFSYFDTRHLDKYIDTVKYRS